MNKLPLEELQEVVVQLCTIFKCAVCAELLQPDTLSCVQGHCICTGCKGARESCPSCERDFSNVAYNAIVRQVLKVIPHTCRYKKCSYLVTAEDDHETYCSYRPTRCRNCEWEGAANELTGHMKKGHPEKVVFLEKTQPILTSCDLNAKLNVTSQFLVYGHFLWLLEALDPAQGVMRFTFLPVFCGKPTHDVHVRLMFKAEHKEYRVSTRLRMEAGVDPGENSLLVPVAALRHFHSQETRELQYSVFVTKSRRRK